MALYNDLEIYKDTLVLSKCLRQRIYKLTNKYYKFGIGEEICRLLRSIKFQICRINARSNDKKLPYLVELTEQLHHLSILIEECVDIYGVFNYKEYAISFVDWGEWINMNVEQETLDNFTYSEICAAALYEMTYHGFTEEKVNKTKDSLINSIK